MTGEEMARVAEAAQNLLAQAEAKDARLAEMVAGVQPVTGELGDLLRAIASAYTEWDVEERFGCVTEGESRRMERIAFSTLALYEAWFRGEQ